MTDHTHPEETTNALQVACDTEVSGCVFQMRTEPEDKQRLLEIARDHVNEQHGGDYTTEEIDEKHLVEVEV